MNRVQNRSLVQNYFANFYRPVYINGAGRNFPFTDGSCMTLDSRVLQKVGRVKILKSLRFDRSVGTFRTRRHTK